MPEAAQLQGESSATPFLQGLAYKLQAKHIPQKHSLKAKKAYFVSKYEFVQSLKTNYQIEQR